MNSNTNGDPTPGQLDELLGVALDAARAAARLIVEERPVGLLDGDGVETKSSTTDMVTVMDQAAEAEIRRRILAARPGDTIVGEEGGTIEGDSGIEWWVDPIDGTTNYVYNHPGFSVSVAAAPSGRPDSVVGVVVVPGLAEEFWATAGGGAFRNGERLRARTGVAVEAALVATGFGYRPERRTAQARVVADLVGRVRDVRRMGAASVDLCSVACGRVDAYYEVGLARWDYAAGALVAAEAGALVTDLRRGPVRPGSLFAAEPGLHARLWPVLDEAGAAAAEDH